MTVTLTCAILRARNKEGVVRVKGGAVNWPTVARQLTNLCIGTLVRRKRSQRGREGGREGGGRKEGEGERSKG